MFRETGADNAGGGAGAGPATEWWSSAPEVIEQKVNSEIKRIPREEIPKLISMGASAQEKWQEASKLKAEADQRLAEAQRGIEFQKLLEGHKNGDADATRRLAIAMGVSEADYDQAVGGQRQPRRGQSSENPLADYFADNGPLPEAVLPPKYRGFFAKMEELGITPDTLGQLVEGRRNDVSSKARDFVKTELSKDPHLNKMLKQEGSPLLEKVWEGVSRRVESGTDFRKAIAEEQASLKALLATYDRATLSPTGTVQPASFGGAPAVGTDFSRFQPDKPPKKEDYLKQEGGAGKYVDAMLRYNAYLSQNPDGV